jgi:hypothetical protein
LYHIILDEESDKRSQKIISELENIDDECEEKDISFVKTSDPGIQKEYDLPSLPALVFYRNKFRQIYTGTFKVMNTLQIFTLLQANV